MRASIERNGQELRVARARAALIQRRPDARRSALAVTAGRGHGLTTRVKALAAAVAPGAARRRAARAPRETTAGIMLPPEDPT